MQTPVVIQQPGPEGWYLSNWSASKRWWMRWNVPPNSHLLLSVLTMPIGAAIVWHLAGDVSKAHTEFVMTPDRWKAIRIIASASVVWISTFYICQRIHQAHTRHGLKFRATDAGLDIRAPFVQTSINWTKVRRVFANNYNEYMICTTDGNYYFPADQPWSQDLYEKIHQHAGIKEVNHFSAMHTLSTYRLSWYAMSFTLLVAIIFQYLKPFIYGTPTSLAYMMSVTLFALPFLLLIGGIVYLLTVKVPDVFRVGEKEIYILDLAGEHVIPRAAVTRVRKFGGFVMVSTRAQSWLVLKTLVFDPANPLISGKKLKLKEQAKIAKKASESLFLEINRELKSLTHSKT